VAVLLDKGGLQQLAEHQSLYHRHAHLKTMQAWPKLDDFNLTTSMTASCSVFVLVAAVVTEQVLTTAPGVPGQTSEKVQGCRPAAGRVWKRRTPRGFALFKCFSVLPQTQQIDIL